MRSRQRIRSDVMKNRQRHQRIISDVMRSPHGLDLPL